VNYTTKDRGQMREEGRKRRWACKLLATGCQRTGW